MGATVSTTVFVASDAVVVMVDDTDDDMDEIVLLTIREEINKGDSD
jgi:hypothetical protein